MCAMRLNTGILGGGKLKQSMFTTKIIESSSVLIVVHCIVKPHILIEIETFVDPWNTFRCSDTAKNY